MDSGSVSREKGAAAGWIRTAVCERIRGGWCRADVRLARPCLFGQFPGETACGPGRVAFQEVGTAHEREGVGRARILLERQQTTNAAETVVGPLIEQVELG